MVLAPFLEKSSPDRAPGRFADFLFVPKHPKADVLLTMILGPLRGEAHIRPYRRGGTSPGIIHPKLISTRSAGAWPSTIQLSIIRLSVPTCNWLSPSLLGPGGDDDGIGQNWEDSNRPLDQLAAAITEESRTHRVLPVPDKSRRVLLGAF